MVDLYNLGSVNWIESQSLYHALALLDREGVIICYPDSPYVCLGLHDDLEHEIDQYFCQEAGIPLLRRETGGGVVYLDRHQVFYQLVLRRDNPLLPLRRQQFYEKLLRPAISLCRSMGVPVELKPPADLAVQGRKCSGNACGDIEGCVAYVGNLLLEFDFLTMSRILRVPDDNFRRHLHLAMRENMTTLADWGKQAVDYYDLASGLIDGFAREIGDLTPCRVDRELKETAEGVGNRLTSPEWLRIPGRRSAQRKVKIAEGIYLAERISSPRETSCVLSKDGTEAEITSANFWDRAVTV